MGIPSFHARKLNGEFKMPVTDNKIKGYAYSDEMASGIRMRVGLLVILSSSAVALAFGISFYFALVSSQTAVAMQVPELAPIVTKLKSLLVGNTVGFIAVIILSFWFLSRMLTQKMFISLGIVMAGLRKAAENRYPETSLSSETGPFGEFESMWNAAVSETREKERAEIDILEKVIPSLSGPGAADAKAAVERMIGEKKQRLCTVSGGQEPGKSAARDKDEKLFMQPV
jgi:hypothetical protein